MRTLRLAGLLALAVSQWGCAWFWSGRDQSERVQRAIVRVEEPDARLRCGGGGCSGAEIERTVTEGHSSAIFWTGAILEFLAAMGPAIGTHAADPSTKQVPTWAALMLLGFGPIWIVDMAFGLTGVATSSFGTNTGSWKLKDDRALVADWRGAQVPIALRDVVPFDAQGAPKGFSVEKAAERSNIEFIGAKEKQAMAARKRGGEGSLAVLDLKDPRGVLDLATREQLANAVSGIFANHTTYEVWPRDSLLARCDDATACEGGRENVTPVVATAGTVDLRRSAKLTDPDDYR